MLYRLYVLTVVAVYCICFGAWAYDSAATRFGIMTLGPEEDSVGGPLEKRLLLEGEEILPSVKWRDSLTFLGVFPLYSSDLVLVQDNNGSGCPAYYYIIDVSAAGITATPRFRSCSDAIRVSWLAMALQIEMPSWLKEENDVYVYDGRHSGLTLNGAPVTADMAD